VALCVLSVIGFVVAMALRMVREGASDISFIIAFSLVGLIGVAIVAPGRFTGKEEPGDFSSEIEKLHAEDNSGVPPKKRKWQ